MDYRSLGNSDLKVSAVTFGAWAIGGLFWGGADERDAIAAIQRSIDEGVTTIDTAPIYGCGASEEVIGKAIRGRRDKVQILTKFGLRWDTDQGTHYFDLTAPDGSPVRVHKLSSRQSVIRECEESLTRLGVDVIDLYQHHWPDPAFPIEETFAAVDQLLRDGKIRHAGVSNYTIEQMQAARRIVPIVSNQPPYSMVRREIEEDILPWCLGNGLGVLVYSPMQMGLLTGKVTEDRDFPPTDIRSRNNLFSRENRRRVNAFLDKLRPIAQAHDASLANVVIDWTIRRPGVTAALVGARNEWQAAENARGGVIALDADEIATIDRELADLWLEP
jgi:aryl-alcohol dehydrogenase-like predicted oxidoreductase